MKSLGRWPADPAAGPRRLLMIADAAGAAPDTLTLSPGSVAAVTSAPSAEMKVFAHAMPEEFDKSFYWERHQLQIKWQDRSIGIAMGMRVGGEVHWWEYCNLVTVAESAACLEVEMGGVIPYEINDASTVDQYKGRASENPYLHKHNWLNGHIYARLHTNGVCEVFARHVNSMFADDGADLQDVVPVVGFRVDWDDQSLKQVCGVWDGSQTTLQTGGVQFDLTDAARLATPEQPGRLDVADGFLAWQPYMGAQLYSGPIAKARTGDDYAYHAEQRIFPRGMARTLRFSLSLDPQRSPRVARYLAPAWWYGVCEEFMPEPLLPVSSDYDAAIDSARMWCRTFMVDGGFEDGAIPTIKKENPAERSTPSAEGDVPGALFLTALRTGDAQDYDAAMRASYCLVDVFVDHAVKRVRMQDFVPPQVALPLQRAHSMIAAWLETGDQFLINTAQAVVQTAYWWHKNSWPRMAVGRDASFIHSAMLLHRFLGGDQWTELARDAIRDVGAAQWPDGSFGDQGGGSGIHGLASYIVKPWMGWLATVGVLDYLEQFPDDEEAQVIVDKFVQWKMRERGPKNDGKTTGWTYQHRFHGKPLPNVTVPEEPATQHLFHFDYVARLMTFCSFREKNASYFDAFAASYEGRGPERTAGYYECAATFYYLPWLQAKLWNARLTETGIAIRPTHMGPRTPTTAIIHGPDGPIPVQWTSDAQVSLPPDANIDSQATWFKVNS